MTDFFSDLERQLVAATPQRARRIRRARRRRAVASTGALLALLASGAGLAAAVGTSEHAGTAATTSPQTTVQLEPVKPAGAATPGVLGSFTTAVLNGTNTPGLARGVANYLQHAHAKIGTVTNAEARDTTRTRVYAAHPDTTDAATRIAKLLDAPAVRPATKRLRAVAGEAADVIVVVGTNRYADRKP